MAKERRKVGKSVTVEDQLSLVVRAGHNVSNRAQGSCLNLKSEQEIMIQSLMPSRWVANFKNLERWGIIRNNKMLYQKLTRLI